MRFELELVRSVTRAELARPDGIAIRRALRDQTDACLVSLLGDNLADLCESCAKTLLCVADAVDRFGDDPAVPDLIRAAHEVITMQRQALDRGLLLSDRTSIRQGAVQLEIVMRGIFATLGVPYEDAVTTAFNNEPMRAYLVSIDRITETKEASDGTEDTGGCDAGPAGDPGGPGPGAGGPAGGH